MSEEEKKITEEEKKTEGLSEKDGHYYTRAQRTRAKIALGLIVAVFLFFGCAMFFGSDVGTVAIGFYAVIILLPIFLFLGSWSINRIYRRSKDSRPTGLINTVILDIGDVLVNFAWQDFIGRHNFPQETFDRIVAASVKNDAWNEFDLGNKTYEEIIDGFIAADPGIEKELRQVFFSEGRLKGLITRRERANYWISEMQKKGYRVLLLSNFSEMALNDCRDQMTFLKLVDGGLLSYTEHVIKPDHAYYQLLIDKYGFTPERAVFIDDNADNVGAAKEMGWHAIQYLTQEQAEHDLRELGVTY